MYKRNQELFLSLAITQKKGHWAASLMSVAKLYSISYRDKKAENVLFSIVDELLDFNKC